MEKSNASQSNSFWNQLLRWCVIPVGRYAHTFCYILFTPERFFRFAQNEKITSYVDISDGRLWSRLRQPLAPFRYLTFTATFFTIVMGFFLGHLQSQLLSLKFIFSFLIIAIALAIYMVVVTRRFRDISFFVNYFCYNISAIYLILLAPLLLGILLLSYFDYNWFIERIISEDLSVVWLAVGFVCSLYLLWSWLIVYLYVVHPVLTFHKIFGTNVYGLVLSIVLFWSVSLTVFLFFYVSHYREMLMSN